MDYQAIVVFLDLVAILVLVVTLVLAYQDILDIRVAALVDILAILVFLGIAELMVHQVILE